MPKFAFDCKVAYRVLKHLNFEIIVWDEKCRHSERCSGLAFPGLRAENVLIGPRGVQSC